MEKEEGELSSNENVIRDAKEDTREDGEVSDASPEAARAPLLQHPTGVSKLTGKRYNREQRLPDRRRRDFQAGSSTFYPQRDSAWYEDTTSQQHQQPPSSSATTLPPTQPNFSDLLLYVLQQTAHQQPSATDYLQSQYPTYAICSELS